MCRMIPKNINICICQLEINEVIYYTDRNLTMRGRYIAEIKLIFFSMMLYHLSFYFALEKGLFIIFEYEYKYCSDYLFMHPDEAIYQ